MNSFRNHDEAFTGLEAAIVLIAFVVVAAVFSYVVLGAGFFTTQKSQEVVHTGVEQASSTLEVVGNVYGVTATAGAPTITFVNFSVGLAAGGTSVDFDKVVMTYSNATELVTLRTSVSASGSVQGQPAANGWSVTGIQNALPSTGDLLRKANNSRSVQTSKTEFTRTTSLTSRSNRLKALLLVSRVPLRQLSPA